MNISRRHFILGSAGAAAGLILPAYYQRALDFISRTGEPLLESVDRPIVELKAFRGCWDGMDFKLAVGDPYAGPPPLTLRQFVERYNFNPWDDWYQEDDCEPDWDAKVDWDNECALDTWMYKDAPEKRAYELLAHIDLGPDLIGDDAVGEVRLESGSTMVSSYWNVDAADDISLSLLQERLNALNTGIRISVM